MNPSTDPLQRLLEPNANTQTPWNFADIDAAASQEPLQYSEKTSLKLKLPAMPNTRSSARQRSESLPSGSEYHASDPSMDVDDHDDAPDVEEGVKNPIDYTTSQRGRKVPLKSYKESESEEGDDPLDFFKDEDNQVDAPAEDDRDEEEEDLLPRRTRPKRNQSLKGVVQSDDEGQAIVEARYPTRNRSKQVAASVANGHNGGRLNRKSSRPKPPRPGHSSRRAPPRQNSRRTRASARLDEQDGNYEDDGEAEASSSVGSADAFAEEEEPEELDLGHDADADADIDADAEGEGDEQDGKPYALRQRAKINYAIPPPLEEMKAPPPRPRNTGRSNGRAGKSKAPGWSATGAELSRWMGGLGGDDSDSDFATRTPRKNFGLGAAGAGGGIFAGGAGAGGLLPGDLAAAAGTPSNLGKVGDAALADADPLGVNQNVTFDEVGGLEDHINALKEMTLLPLLYPEVFQRFNLTPPRGVLFHGPPGTGKTLLARALAASCRSNGKGISFFMRKGADCLSKWVGEAERQLRLLFEEARNQQPSIIFFDEIDGLAPVRSSKQDQIHASIVSTLLALMDGMDGRGQVVVIGATNRPDAIDPALRRPGRFDREFYFPLPNLAARERIIRIMTRKWEGWEEKKGEDHAKGLAKLTKGYGGADIRALCTEAALNAVQRRYPQIYKSSDRLLLKPETINVELRDFMISVKKLVPSSARATAPAASPLPEQLVPLLQNALERIRTVINQVLPVSKKRTALEEAEFEDEGSSESALDRELMLQSMETLRIYRPRVALYGPQGMGHTYVASAALHHLEGYHVQSLDLGNLLSDSTRTPEAAIVQLFLEAKRHQPSVIYIPSLTGWCAAVSETSRTTVRAMLDSLAPTDPVLLLAVIDGTFAQLPRDVKAWFGPTRDNRVELARPTAQQREEFFEKLVKDVARPPNHFPDGIQRKKRILEELPIAPPLEPRQPSAAELAIQQDTDQRTLTMLKFRLGPILQELKRKFKRFTKRASEEYGIAFDQPLPPPAPTHQLETVTTTVEVHRSPNGDTVQVVNEDRVEQAVIDVDQPMADAAGAVDVPINVDGMNEAVVQEQVMYQPQLFDVDLERMHVDLYRDKYLTPDEFLDDVRKIVHNANVRANDDPERLFRAQAMLTAAEVSIQDFDVNFRMECQRMSTREQKRRDEYRRNKAKEKAANGQAAQNGAQNLPIRRSTRHTGQLLEISITDPLLLERRLKRARSAEANAEPSEEEAGDDGHAAKRSRVSSAEVDGQAQPHEHVGSPPPRTHAVRFVDDISQKEEPSSPTPHANDPLPDLPVHFDSEGPNEQRSTAGFDPALLNPMSPETEQLTYALTPTGSNLQLPAEDVTVLPTPNGIMHAQANGLQESHPLSNPSTNDEQLMTSENQFPLPPASPAPEPMQIERTPTPLPDFIVDPEAVFQLRTILRDKTDLLNIEHLEQLRATCLALVWKHRTEWDRAGLIRELAETVERYVEEVALDDMDSTSPMHGY